MQLGDTALIWAASNGHTAIVQQLIQAGAKVNHQNAVNLMLLWLITEDTKVNTQGFIQKVFWGGSCKLTLHNIIEVTHSSWLPPPHWMKP